MVQVLPLMYIPVGQDVQVVAVVLQLAHGAEHGTQLPADMK